MAAAPAGVSGAVRLPYEVEWTSGSIDEIATPGALRSIALERSRRRMLLAAASDLGFDVARSDAFVIERGALFGSTAPGRGVVSLRALFARWLASRDVDGCPTFGNEEPGLGRRQIEHVTDLAKPEINAVDTFSQLSRQPDPHHSTKYELPFPRQTFMHVNPVK